MTYHVESFIVCDGCYGCRVSMPGHNGRDVVEREASRRGWSRVPLALTDDGLGNYCKECGMRMASDRQVEQL